jgi:N-carbamoylputrescine amidase
MRVTVCQLPDRASGLEAAWGRLVAHAGRNHSELVLLPEMPFSPWFATTPTYEAGAWRAAVQAHEAWLPRVRELAPAAVLGTRPVDAEGQRHNQAFVWEPESGLRGARSKALLPNEEGVWEASWYHAAEPVFEPVEAGGARVGFLICTELWAMERAKAYGESGAQLLVTPRLTVAATLDKWLAGGRVAAVVAGAYSLSSNRCAPGGAYGGRGWVIDPDGEVLAITSDAEPFVTVDIDLCAAERARATYPRYILSRH